MKKELKNVMDFYLLATKLKYKIRSGWDKNHWNINSSRLESIAEHVYGTCILAIAIDSEFEYDIDLGKVIIMLVLHEVGEVLIGDITPFDQISKEEKIRIEHEAVNKIFDGICKKEEYLNFLLEFDSGETNEAKFAHLVDKLEADIQAKVYQDMGYQNSLDKQDTNVALKSEKVLQMIDGGAETAFDIWYLWDKSIYEGEPIFKEILKYVKDNDMNI